MVEKNKPLAQQVEKLEARLKKLEARFGKANALNCSEKAEEALSQCALPEVPERTFGTQVSAHRARLIRWIDKKWVNGTRLHYYFFNSGSYAGGSDQLAMVRKGFEIWESLGIGIAFEEVTNIADAEIRIGFLDGDGAWSYLGRDAIDIPGQHERTMNFGWDLTRDPRGVDTPVHEIGHALGFPHEHQNPFSGIVWDDQAVYAYFGGSPNYWSRETTFYNVLRKLSAGEVEGSPWDPDSIMHYGFPAGLIVEPEAYRDGLRPAPGLSEQDIAEVRRFYPALEDASNARLEPLQLEFLALAPGEQKNLNLAPQSTNDYTIQTFGRSDTVMVLFEEVDGKLNYVDGDDDSGTRQNARLSVRLQQGKRYVLRIRLYLNYACDDTAVMWW